MNSLPKTVTRQRRGCDLNQGPSAPESSTLTTRPCKGNAILKVTRQEAARDRGRSLLSTARTGEHRPLPTTTPDCAGTTLSGPRDSLTETYRAARCSRTRVVGGSGTELVGGSARDVSRASTPAGRVVRNRSRAVSRRAARGDGHA